METTSVYICLGIMLFFTFSFLLMFWWLCRRADSRSDINSDGNQNSLNDRRFNYLNSDTGGKCPECGGPLEEAHCEHCNLDTKHPQCP